MQRAWPQSSVPSAQCCVQTVSAQRGPLARTAHAAGWQHAAGTQSASVLHDGCGSLPRAGSAAMLLPPGPTAGGISDGTPLAGEGWSGCPDCTLDGEGGLADADAGPGSA